MINFILFNFYLILPLYIFIVGFIGILSAYDNLLRLMISFELSFLGLVTLFVFYGQLMALGNLTNLCSLVLLSIAAGESSLGFGLLVAGFKLNKSLNLNSFNLLKG